MCRQAAAVALQSFGQPEAVNPTVTGGFGLGRSEQDLDLQGEKCSLLPSHIPIYRKI
jgi:hypothetical protein